MTTDEICQWLWSVTIEQGGAEYALKAHGRGDEWGMVQELFVIGNPRLPPDIRAAIAEHREAIRGFFDERSAVCKFPVHPEYGQCFAVHAPPRQPGELPY